MAESANVGSIFWNLSVKTDDAEKSINKLSNSVSSLNKLFGLFKVSVFLKGLKSIGETIGKVTQRQTEFIQTQNLFNKTMGNYISKATDFRDEMEKRLGMDPKDVMSSMNAFKQLAETFGINEERSYLMSKNLTQLASDMTAYGYSFENAMKKLKSGLAGEIEPMRAIGVALDKATLQQTLYSLGIDRTFDSLTRAQKTELLYYQIMTQTSKMQGELGRTILTPAQSIRIMKQEFTQLARAVGSIFIPIMMKIIPVVRAVTQILISAAKAIANFFGFDLADYSADYSTGLEDMSIGLEDIEDNANGAAKALKKMLMPFDELNNVNFDTGSSGGGIGIGGGGQLLDDLPQYDIFKSIVGNVDEQVEKIKAKMKELIPVFVAVGATIATIFTVKKFVEFVEWIDRLKKALEFLGPLGFTLKTIASAVMIVVGAFLYFKGIKDILDKTTKGVGGLAKALGGLTLATTGIYLLFGGIPALITGIIGAIGIIVTEIIKHWEEIKTFFISIGNWINEHTQNFFKGLWNGIIENLEPLIEQIKNAFIAAWEAIKVVWEIAEPFFASVWAGIKGIWNVAVGFFKIVWEGIKGVFSVVGSVIGGFFKIAWEAVKAVWNVAINFFEMVWAGIQAVFNTVKSVLTGNFEDAWNGIKNVWEKAKGFFQSVWDGIKNVFSSVGLFFKNTFTSAWEAVKNVFSKGGQIFEGIKEGIFETFKEIVNGLINGINNVVAIPFRTINTVLNKLRNIEILGTQPFSFIPTIDIPKIPYLASGGIVETGQLFIANEAGPELIGNIGNKTAVANNQQITEGIENATYNAMSKALNENGNNPPYINVYLGNDRLYSGFGNYQSNESNRYGVRV